MSQTAKGEITLGDKEDLDNLILRNISSFLRRGVCAKHPEKPLRLRPAESVQIGTAAGVQE